VWLLNLVCFTFYASVFVFLQNGTQFLEQARSRARTRARRTRARTRMGTVRRLLMAVPTPSPDYSVVITVCTTLKSLYMHPLPRQAQPPHWRYSPGPVLRCIAGAIGWGDATGGRVHTVTR
jgi:hypothetical protein